MFLLKLVGNLDTTGITDNIKNFFKSIFPGGLVLLLLLLTAFLSPSYVNAQTNTWDGSTSTDWNTASNWSLNLVPTAAHDVIIPNSVPGSNDDPVINTAAVCSTLTMNSGNRARTLSISGSNSLTVTNGITIGAGTGFGDDKIIDVGTGTLSCASIDVTAAGFGRSSGVTLSTGIVNVTGDITMGNGNDDFTFTGAGTLNIGGTMSGGTLTPSIGTVNYNGANQTVGSYTYYNLTFSGSGTKDMTGVSVIDGDFTMSGTSIATATSNLDINGSVTLGSGTSFTAGAFSHTVAGDWTNNGGTFSSTGSTITLDGTAQSIGGSNSTTFNDLTLAGSNTKTFGLSTTITGNLYINTGVVVDLGTFTTHTADGLIFGGAGKTAGTWGSSSSAAANQNDTFFAASSGFITVASTAPTTYYSRQTGNWNANTTWSTVTYGNATNNGTFPVAGDIVNIGGGNFTITVNVASACGSLSFEENASNSPIVSINSGITLDVSGTITIPNTANFSGDINTLAVGAGTLNAGSIAFTSTFFGGSPTLTISTGTVTITGDVTNNNGFFSTATITFTDAGLLQLRGAFLDSGNGTLTPSTGTVEYNGTTAQTIGDFTYNNLTLSGSGTKDVAGAFTAGGTFTLESGTSFTAGTYTHNVAGDWINNGATFSNTNSTINLNGAVQTIGGSSPTTFNNLTLAGSNTKTFSQATTINATLSINSGVVANLSTITTHTAKTLALNGAGQAPGTWGSTSSIAANQNDTYFTSSATGIITVTNRIYYTRQTGNWNVNSSWSTVTFGDATNTGTFPSTGDIVKIGGTLTITVTANATCAFIDYESDASNTNTLTINSGITLDVSDAITIPRTSNFSGEVNTLAVGSGILNAESILFNGGGFFGAHELTISTGTVTVTGDIDSDSFFGIATITFTGSGLLQVGGTFLDSSNGTLTPSTGTVEYNGTVAQTIGDFTYSDLTLNNTSGSIPQLALTANTTATNTLTLTSGVVNMNGSTFTLGASGATSTLTRTVSTTTNWMYGGTFLRFWPASTAITSANYGLFPVGTSAAASYRPVEINSTANPTGTGYFSVTHTDASTTTDLSPTHNDGGTSIVRKHDAQFVTATTATGGTYDISVTMTGLNSTGVLSDIRLALSNGSTTVTTVGTHAVATGTVNNPTASRTGVSLANLVGDFRIATTNATNTPLPIELTYFDAKVIDKAVNLRWQTKSELNNDFFTIERSQNGEQFEELTTVNGAGNSNNTLDYLVIDRSPLDGISYYRLKQTDFDGNYEYSEIVLVQFDKGDQLTVYPNPITGNSFNLSMKGEAGQEVLVKLYNPFGELVDSRIIELKGGHTPVPIRITKSLVSGVYVLTGSTQDKFYSKKVLISSH